MSGTKDPQDNKQSGVSPEDRRWRAPLMAGDREKGSLKEPFAASMKSAMFWKQHNESEEGNQLRFMAVSLCRKESFG